jgi:hypothetical protein
MKDVPDDNRIEFRLAPPLIKILKQRAVDQGLANANLMARDIVQEELLKLPKEVIQKSLKTVHQNQQKVYDKLEMFLQYFHYWLSSFYALHPESEKNIVSARRGIERRDELTNHFIHDSYNKNADILERFVATKNEDT